MSQINQVVEKIKESAGELVRLTDSPDPANPNWYAEVGQQLSELATIHAGEWESSPSRKPSFLKKVIKSINE